MAYCVRCGAKLDAGDKFCGGCGKSVELVPAGDSGAAGVSGSSSSAPASMASPSTVPAGKGRGAVRCPVCGEYLDKHATVCSACGFTVRDAAEGSIAVLADKLAAIERERPKRTMFVGRETYLATDRKKADLIRNFPIPNSYDDLLEFMTMARANSVPFASNNELTAAGEEIVAAAWGAKFDQACAKAEHLCGDEDGFEEFRALRQGREDDQKRARLKKYLPVIASICMFVFLMLFVLLMSVLERQGVV